MCPQEMSRSLGLELVETSAKDSLNVEKMFEQLVQLIMERRYVTLGGLLIIVI
jgi:hypothetical protein